MDKIVKNKRGLELVNGCSLGHKTNPEKLFKFDDVIKSSFRKLHLLIYVSQFMAWIFPLPFVPLILESVEKKWKNYNKLNISRANRAFKMK